MARGPLYEHNYHPQLSGHETFPLRYGWLKKAFEAVHSTEGQPNNRAGVFSDDAIARFGVGRNMVASMRHWANAAGIIREPKNTNMVETTKLGRKLFGGSRPLDPYMEHPATLWLIHWQLSAHPEKTTWFWAFNHFPAVTFEREHLVKGLDRLAKELGWSRAAGSTIKNDVACFIRTYAAQSGHEDALESPLTELGLIKPVHRRDGFRFVRGQKSNLGDGVFVYALIDFWERYSKTTTTLAFEAIAHAPGSPGRVFLLDENDVVDRLASIDGVTDGAFQWSETAGLKQVLREADLDVEKALRFAEKDYGRSSTREAA